MARIYNDLAEWYPMLDPREDHEDEATIFAQVLRNSFLPFKPADRHPTLLELGCGAGNNAWYLKQHFACTLTDLSPAMLAHSRVQNPECEHVQGDMRTLRLERQFDAVFVHDAVAYITNEDDLRAVAETAFLHTRPGGAALFAPDYVAETFEESSNLHQGDMGDKSMRCLEWAWDPDPSDTTCRVDFAFLLRDRSERSGEVHSAGKGSDESVRLVHDTHIEGLFPRATWVRVLESAGFTVTVQHTPLDGFETYEVFVCQRS